MEDTYQYRVFFDCLRLDEEKKKRIENYFKILRKSGGGDCGSVTKVNDKVYSIAFKDKEAQQRVLQRSEHVLESAGGPLVLTVRDSPGPAGKSASTMLDSNSSQAFQSAQETLRPRRIMNNADPDQEDERRIVILGKSGAGKSSLANTIFGESLFEVDDTFSSGTKKCEAKTKSIKGRSVTSIDTPGFFDTDIPEEQLKAEIVRCITECSAGAHAFLIVLKVENFTKQEQAVIDKVRQYFSEEAFKYATIVFTHGDQLPRGKTVEDHVHQNEHVSDLVKKCGGRCHVIDNKYWNDNVKNEYRSNRFQVAELLRTINETVKKNNGRCYTNEMLQAVEGEIKQEEELIRRSASGNMSEEEIRNQAKANVFTRLLVRLAGIGTGALLGALCGVGVVAAVAYIYLNDIKPLRAAGSVVEGASGGTAAGGTVAGILGTCAAVGAVAGGVVGYRAAEGADTPKEAAEGAAKAFKKGVLAFIHGTKEFLPQNFLANLKKH